MVCLFDIEILGKGIMDEINDFLDGKRDLDNVIDTITDYAQQIIEISKEIQEIIDRISKILSIINVDIQDFKKIIPRIELIEIDP